MHVKGTVSWDRIGSDRIGSDRIGSDRIGSDRIGSDLEVAVPESLYTTCYSSHDFQLQTSSMLLHFVEDLTLTLLLHFI
jgi:hypothetical protein